jgi:hypothetical protein
MPMMKTMLTSGCLCAVLIGSAPLPAGAQPAGSPPLLSHPLGGSAPAKAAANASPAQRAAYREIQWDDLVPKDWDPLAQFKGMNLGTLSDGDPRAADMLKRMREAWDNAPASNAMDGAAVRIPGYVVPLEETKAGIKEFLLVPYFGACIHSPPPPANQIIYVLPRTPAKELRSMDMVWISGTLKVVRSDSYMGASGYRMEAMAVEPYVEKKR